MRQTTLQRRTPLKAKRGLRPRKRINRISPMQAARNQLWNEITDERAIEEHHICQWCHQSGQRLYPQLLSYLDGHHTVKPRRSHNKPEYCYIVHRFQCHGEIEDNNIDVRVYHDREAWLKSKEALNETDNR